MSHHWKQFERFLLLGSERGIYSVAGPELVLDRVAAVRSCLLADGSRVVKTLIEAAAPGGAQRLDPALFVLAMAASPAFGDARTNAAALAGLGVVARTSPHLFAFADFVEGLRGWGRGLRSAIEDWYLAKPVTELAREALTHGRGEGWSHRDLLRLSHPKADTPERNLLFRWLVDGEMGSLAPESLRQVVGVQLARAAHSAEEVAGYVEEYRLTAEMVPERWLESAQVWEALLDRMPYRDMVRRLGKMTAVGLVAAQSGAAALVVARLMDRGRVERSKVHPVELLEERLAYEAGSGWTPVGCVVEALNEAFTLAMGNAPVCGRQVHVTVEGGGVLARGWAEVFARTEPYYVMNRSAAEAVVIATGDGCVVHWDGAPRMGVVGFDASVPGVVARFLSGYGRT